MGKLTKKTLLRRGAEGSLFLADWQGRRVIIKTRLPKKYRPAKLDVAIRSYRTVHEPQLMNEAKKAGGPTPTIYLVDVKTAATVMEFVEGKQVKQVLASLSLEDRKALCPKIGDLIGRVTHAGR